MKIRLATIDDADAIGYISVVSWQETYGGIIPQPFLDALDIPERQEKWKKSLNAGSATFVAEIDGQVVGFAHGGKFRGERSDIQSELYVIYLLAAHHGRGAGRLLFDAVNQQLQSLKPMGVWVLADNPTVLFYQAMGGKQVDERWETIGGKELKEWLFIFPE